MVLEWHLHVMTHDSSCECRKAASRQASRSTLPIGNGNIIYDVPNSKPFFRALHESYCQLNTTYSYQPLVLIYAFKKRWLQHSYIKCKDYQRMLLHSHNISHTPSVFAPSTMGQSFLTSSMLCMALITVNSVLSAANSTLSRRAMVIHERRSDIPYDFTRVGSPHPDTVMNFRIGLAAKDMRGLEKALYDVSTPGSPSYGQHLSADEVLVDPSMFFLD